LPDDYASIWLDNVPAAKKLAREAFEWIEELFASKGLRLIDICFFIDSSGRVLFGEISPDCMRVRDMASDEGEALDKDEWRSGGDPKAVLWRYGRLYSIVFGDAADRIAA
jgi:phosphoribosylaminoimidazole-succinocarboxamide synthase